MKVIEYINSKNMKVQFIDKYSAIVSAQWKEFNNGHLLNPYFPTVYGVGIVGGRNRNHEYQYTYWKNILARCYNTKIKKQHPTYEKCYICNDWFTAKPLLDLLYRSIINRLLNVLHKLNIIVNHKC